MNFDTFLKAVFEGEQATVRSVLAANPEFVSRVYDNFNWRIYGGTPLHAAVAAGQTQIVKFLLDNKADVNARTKEEWTPLHLAADWNRNGKDVATLLLAAHAEVDAKAWDGFTALHFTAWKGRADIAKLLLENNADANAKTRNGMTPLSLAANNGNGDVAELLRRHLSATLPCEQDRSFEELVEELVELSQESFWWGLKNGFPAKYPHDDKARKLGELIFTKRGNQGMQEAAQILQRRVVTDGGGQCFLITYNWHGIGDWRP